MLGMEALRSFFRTTAAGEKKRVFLCVLELILSNCKWLRWLKNAFCRGMCSE